jgi:hypothetical protein
MTSYQLKTQTIYCGDNLKMLTDILNKNTGNPYGVEILINKNYYQQVIPTGLKHNKL